MSGDPQAYAERRAAARHLLGRPLTCAEHDPDMFRLIRRHEADLDKWFTQRLGYRLHVTSDTARLFKSGYTPARRPLRTSGGRPLNNLEYVMLVLALASTVAGPAVISLRDLIDLIRSAAAEAEIAIPGDASERRALVSALRFMIDHGLASELHAHVDAYAADSDADAILKMRPDRIAMVAMPVLAAGDDDLVRASSRRENTRQWIRVRLAEDPALYRQDLDDFEWSELRRRLGEESRYAEEMFGLHLEARAEGVAAVDPGGDLADQPFPTGGTEGHACLMLLPLLADRREGWWSQSEVVDLVSRLATDNSRYWAKDLVGAPERFARRVIDTLVGIRLVEVRSDPAGFRLLPAAARFAPAVRQDTLW